MIIHSAVVCYNRRYNVTVIRQLTVMHYTSSCTCEIDGTNGIDMVMDIGGVRPPLAPIWPGEFWPGPL